MPAAPAISNSNSKVGSGTRAAVPDAATAIIQELANQAAQVVGSTTSTQLTQYSQGNQGNLPYYWQDPSNLLFNQASYNWISSCASTSASGVSLTGQPFPNSFQDVFTKVSYSLSKADQQKLNQAVQSATDQQGALLNNWRAQMGSLPTPTKPGQQPIDAVMQIILSWAPPGTTLMDIKSSRNLSGLFANAPASAQPILPLLSNYLNAVGSSLSLQNDIASSNGQLGTVLANITGPSASNGGLQTNQNGYYPAYAFNTQLADIQNGLQATSNAVSLTMTVEQANSSEAKVTLSGGTSFLIPIADLLGIQGSGSVDYFSDQIVTSSSSIQVTMTFTGATLVQFAPVPFDQSQGTGWYWMQPIIDAIKNGSQDVSGYRFAPTPSTDFSANGTFGYVNAAAISNYPTISITFTSSQANSLVQTFQQQSSWSVSFLGIPLASGSQSQYKSNVTQNASSNSVTLTLSPPAELVAGTSIASVGWVLGVQTVYPAAGS